MKNSKSLTVAGFLLAAFGFLLLAAPAPASATASPAEIATAAAPSLTWLSYPPPPQGTCNLSCTGGTLGHPNWVRTLTTYSGCCSYPGTLCPAGTTPLSGSWQPLSGAATLCPFN
jgi:hypothetical protein